jgi:DNA-binding response OmpR family regulator
VLRRRRSAEREPDTRGGPQVKPTRILLVTDDADACELLARILEGAGYPVDRAYDHVGAIAQVTSAPPSGLVLDLSVGGIGANLKLLDAIRTHNDPTVAGARVVLVARQAQNQLFSWQSGVDAFLVRPFHANELLHHVADVLARPDEQRARHRRDQLNQAEGR